MRTIRCSGRLGGGCPGGVYTGMECAQGSVCPGGGICLGRGKGVCLRVSVWGGVCPRGVFPRGVCPGGCLPRRVSAQGGLPEEGGGCLPGGVCLSRLLPREVCPRGVFPWGSAWGGVRVSALSVSVPGGVFLGESAPPSPVDRTTDACENITFPQLLLLTVKIETITQIWTLSQVPGGGGTACWRRRVLCSWRGCGQNGTSTTTITPTKFYSQVKRQGQRRGQRRVECWGRHRGQCWGQHQGQSQGPARMRGVCLQGVYYE